MKYREEDMFQVMIRSKIKGSIIKGGLYPLILFSSTIDKGLKMIYD